MNNATMTEPPRVGDWWMCPVCGDAGIVVGFRGVFPFPFCPNHQSVDAIPLTLTEADWLKCRSPQALVALANAANTKCPVNIPRHTDFTESWMRCVVGNPFRPFTPDPSWLTWNDGTVKRLAEGCTSWNKRELCPECNGSGTREPRYSRKERRAGDCLKCKGTGETEYLVEGVVPEQFLILADALEEAGCDRDDVLRHLREPQAHWPGCFVLRAILEAS